MKDNQISVKSCPTFHKKRWSGSNNLHDMIFPYGLLWLVVQVEFECRSLSANSVASHYSGTISLYLFVYLISTVFYFQLSTWILFHKVRLPWKFLNKDHLEILKVVFIIIQIYCLNMKKASSFSSLNILWTLWKRSGKKCKEEKCKDMKTIFHRKSLICNQY